MTNDARAEVLTWFRSKVPAAWGSKDLSVELDSDEILVTIKLPEPKADETSESDNEAGARARVNEFREATRQERMDIASAAEKLFNRKVSWAASAGDFTKPFTGLGMPVMSRLRLPERALLDTLVDAGVARSRSHAVSWCLKLVASKQEDWLSELRAAFGEVEKVRAKGPSPK